MKGRKDIMYEWKTVRRQWLAPFWGLALSLPFVPGVAVAQLDAGFGTRALSMPAKPGAAIVRGRYTSESLRLVQAIGEKFQAKGKLDVAFDDHASFGRFCDRDAPFHVVICEGDLTPHHKKCWERRFPVGTPQPEAFVLGQLGVVLIVHKDNPVRSLDFAQIRMALNPTGKTSKWQDVGGAGSAAIRCYGPSENSWARQLLRDKCMTRWRDADQPGVRELQKLAYRDDLTSCTDAKEVVAKVRGDRHALGFFACCEPLTKHDLQGVKVLPISAKEGDPAVAPPLDFANEQAYPLAEPLCLYLHPSAPAVARQFCAFATGVEAAKIVQQFGIWPQYLAEQAHGKQRLAEVKAGKGTAIVVCDLTGNGDVLKDLSLEFVKAKTAVQLKFQKGGTRDEAVERLAKGATELLLTDGPLSAGEQGSGDRGEGSANPKSEITNPKSVELGRMAVGIIVHPENPLESLPLDEAKLIFCGEIKKWPAVRGAAAAMHVFGLKQSSPTAQLLKEKLAAHKALSFTAQPDNEKVILAVARDPAAIGFVDMSQLPPNDKSVKLVPVTLPGQSFIRQVSTKDTKDTRGNKAKTSLSKNGTGDDGEAVGKSQPPNPLERTLTLCVSPNASQTAKDFAEFLTPEHCKEAIARYNLLPPLHAADAGRKTEVAKAVAKPGRPHPNPLPTNLWSVPGEGTVALANDIPLLLDDPDAPTDQGRAKSGKLAARSKPEAPTPEQPEPPKLASTAKPVPDTESEAANQPTQGHPGSPSLSNEQAVWLAGGIAGVVVVAAGMGWLSALKRKKPRR